MTRQSSLKFKKAFSLVETLITLVVVGIIIIMLSNVLAITLKVSVLANERSHMKNELSSLTQKLDRDISNAEYVFIHNDGADGAVILETKEYRIRWQRCDSKDPRLPADSSLCQYYCTIEATELSASTCDPTTTPWMNKRSSQKLVINAFRVEELESLSGFENQRIKSASVTLQVQHYSDVVNPGKGLGIQNVYKQITFSSNNFIV